jgi:hypothetical protein
MNSGIHPRAGQDILYISSENTDAQQVAQSWTNSEGNAWKKNNETSYL